jgi:hypothetical protein
VTLERLDLPGLLDRPGRPDLPEPPGRPDLLALPELPERTFRLSSIQRMAPARVTMRLL